MLKVKGIKKLFSKSPIDYKKLRKANIHIPSKKQVLGLDFKTFAINDCTITEILPKEMKSKDLILYCPGGSFVSGPNDFNWKSIAYIVKQTGMAAYMIDYPKAPESQITEINNALDDVYGHITERHQSSSIILLGGSVGGTLMTLLVQRLMKKQLPLPRQLILITPVMDCSMANVGIEEIEEKDMMNSRIGIVSAHQMCAGDVDLKSEVISPLYGETKDFIPTVVFIAENDIQRPDVELFCEKLKQSNVKLQVEYGAEMPHIYPLLPIVEGKKALDRIVDYLKSRDYLR